MRSLLGLAFLCGCATATGDPSSPPAPPPPSAAPAGPVVLELFTSQGCSSCPPADRFLNQLAAKGSSGGRAVAPLAFHVDYWNDLGWADPYSAAAWTQRQSQYAESIGDDRVYTPELVVGGAAGVVGNQPSSVEHAIASAAPPAILAATSSWTGSTLSIDVTAPPAADVWVAIWEDGTRTSIPRGENAGTTASADRVVRQLSRVATAGQHATLSIPLTAGFKPGGAVAFAQGANRHIVASALLPPPPR
ncbi:MAG TPA: DUF1223 domain-containing protein [Kofleriaceae bacterium]|jgi:hypothetical protein